MKIVEDLGNAIGSTSVDLGMVPVLHTLCAATIAPLNCQSTLEQLRFLPKDTDSSIRAQSKRLDFLAGLAVPALMEKYDLLADAIRRFEVAAATTGGVPHHLILECRALCGDVGRANMEMPDIGPFASKQVGDMASAFLSTDAVDLWLDEVWGGPNTSTERRLFGAGSNTARALGIRPKDPTLVAMLERYSEKARKIVSLKFQMRPSSAAFEFAPKPRHVGVAPLQLCLCRTSSTIKPMVHAGCSLAVKLATP